MKKSLKIKNVMLIAEQERNLDLENSEAKAIEAAKLPMQIIIDKPIKIVDAVILAYDGNKTFLQGRIEDFDGDGYEVSYINFSDLEKIEPQETISTKKPKSRPSTKNEIDLIIDYLKSNSPEMIDDTIDKIEDEYGDFTTYELTENNLLVIVNCVFIHYFEKESPKVLSVQEKYSIKYGIVFKIDDDTPIDDLNEDISEITSIL